MALRFHLSCLSANSTPLSQRTCRLLSPLAVPKFSRVLCALPAQSRHDFHTSPTHLNNSLFNLGGLSTSRECQYFAKERGIPRTEFSPHLELIRSSEVDTFGGPGSRKSSTSTAQPPIDSLLVLDDAVMRIQRLEGTCQGLLEEIKTRTQKDQNRHDLWKVLAGASACLALFCTMAMSTELRLWANQAQIVEAVEIQKNDTAAEVTPTPLDPNMSTTDILGRADGVVQKAIESDTAGEYEKAYQLYYQALELFILALKWENSEQNKSMIRAKATEYMERAEKLKAYLAGEDEAMETWTPPAETLEAATKGPKPLHNLRRLFWASPS